MGQALLIAGLALNLLVIAGLVWDTHVRAKAAQPAAKGPLGPIKQDFFRVRQVSSTRAVAGVALVTLGLLSAYYFSETSQPVRAELPAPTLPDTFAAENQRVASMAFQAASRLQVLFQAAQNQPGGQPDEPPPPVSEPGIPDTVLEAVVLTVLANLERSTPISEGSRNPNQIEGEGAIVDSLRREFERLGQRSSREQRELSNEDVSALADAARRWFNRDRADSNQQTNGTTDTAPVIDRDDPLVQAIRTKIGELRAAGVPGTRLNEGEFARLVAGVRQILDARPPQPPVPPSPPSPTGPVRVADILIDDLRSVLDLLERPGELAAEVSPLPAGLDDEAYRIRRDLTAATARLTRIAAQLKAELAAAGTVRLSELEDAHRETQAVAGRLRQLLSDTDALVAQEAARPPEPVVPRAPPVPYDIIIGVFANCLALVAFWLASINFHQRVKAGVFGERRDEMERLIAFALKRGLGPPPAAPPPSASGAMA